MTSVLQELLDRHIARGTIPGGVASLDAGEPEIAAAGVMSVGGPPMRADAIVRVQSMTKAITAIAALRLVETGATAWVEITVVEGRKHQVRNMFDAVGHRVQRLRRIRYGGVELGTLRPGALRPLTPREVDRLRRAAAPRNPMKSPEIS